MGLDFYVGPGDDFERALEQTGFGKFHFILLAVCGLIYLNTAVGVTIISFVLPSATCDFRMHSSDKGWLTASPMLGMLIGSYFWGCLADTKGRKVVLIGALLTDGICGLVSSISQVYWLFLILRFINGFAITGAMGICFPYLGEFQPTKYREIILCWMEMFWALGVIILPGIAWIIIPMQFEYISGSFKYSSWNLFVAACSIPSLLIGLWLFFFPESPKFLFECGEVEEALKVLKNMYASNTGDDRENFPVRSFRERRGRAMSIASHHSIKSIRSLRLGNPKELKILLGEIWEQTKALCKPPHLRYTIITCLIQFGLSTSYYTLMIWFPELFYRFEEFEHFHPNKTATVCEVSSVVVAVNGTQADYCGDPIDDTVFLHTVIIGLSCIPTSLWLPLSVHKLSAKFFLVFSLSVAGAVTIGLYFIASSTSNLVLSCIFEAFTSLGISILYCVMVDLFPTHLRVMAAALSLTFGRAGALIGNLLFGFLIDLNCVVPIALFASMLIASALMCFLLPNTGRESLD